ncbi:DUF934 domain-containing protein [Paludibacterium paludis]|uniref:DUF934 domain-containing protein n=1 Tax=Paludibacterium paludis TaxID=1225769 RepID=A0A918UBC6_9NEIS|nr:DUF934 domain-containing protein [Paludibacterium paludis]GGY21415.1 hypothetical protein GCM10011289_26230 [Paludibacterium paludis]
MARIIKDGMLIEDDWVIVRPDEEGGLRIPDHGRAVMPLAGLERGARVPAVWLSPSDDPADYGGDWNAFSLVAVDFPAFTDGRGYSVGRLLRERYKYAGELRAIGDVWKDQLEFLWQVGFNAFEIKHGKPVEEALEALESFSGHYQSTWRQPEPLFRRGIK